MSLFWYGFWDGDPAVMIARTAWFFCRLDKEWVRAKNSTDVIREAAALTKVEYKRRFSHLPPLPSYAFPHKSGSCC
jgi:hypothetical protein